MTITAPFEVTFLPLLDDVNEGTVLELNNQNNLEVKVIYDELMMFGVTPEQAALINVKDHAVLEDEQLAEFNERKAARALVVETQNAFEKAANDYHIQRDYLQTKLQQLEDSAMEQTVELLDKSGDAIQSLNDLNQKAQERADATLALLKLREQNYASTPDALPVEEVPVQLSPLQVLVNRSKTLLSSLTKKA
jgi:hypothetical protein